MNYLLSFLCSLLSLPLCIVAYIIVERRILLASEKESDSNTTETAVENTAVSEKTDSCCKGKSSACHEENKSVCGETQKTATNADDAAGENKTTAVNSFLRKIKELTTLQIILLIVAFITIGVSSFFVFEEKLPWYRTMRIIVSAHALLCAAVIDLFTKKIPNKIPLLLTLFSFIFLAIEFIWYNSVFYNSILLCTASGIIVFIVLCVFSLLTRGGFGMGDTKIISTITFNSGVVLTLYSSFVGLLCCMVTSIVLLISRRKKLRDDLPFGPFIYIGFFVCCIAGKF